MSSIECGKTNNTYIRETSNYQKLNVGEIWKRV